MEWGDNEIAWAEDGWLFGSASSPLHISQLRLDRTATAPGAICSIEGGCIRMLADDEKHYWDEYVQEAINQPGGFEAMQKMVENHLMEEFS